MKELEQLNAQERNTVELRYLGNSYDEIAEKTGLSPDTLRHWFKSEGRLHYAFNQYTEHMNKKRMEENEKRVSVADEEWYVLTTNIVRQIGRRVQNSKRPVVDKNGNVVADENGEPKMVEVPPDDFHTNDLERVWKMQRIMKGLPTTYEKKDVAQTNYETDLVIRELGLTERDFEDDRIDETTKRITEYIRSQ